MLTKGDPMKKVVAGLSLAAFLIAVAPKKTGAQILEGALIGAAVGGVVGLVLHFMKPKVGKEPAPENAEVSSPAAPKAAFVPGTEVIEEPEEPASK
jgi:hypothetical protein